MGLTNTMQQAALTVFQRLGDLARPVTYKSLTGNVTRDIVAGTVTPESVDYVIPRTVFTKFRESENDKDISVLTDEKLIFPSRDLPVEAKSSDLIVDAKGRTWEIVRLLSDDASAVTILQVRTSR